jgi:hypothetical protein
MVIAVTTVAEEAACLPHTVFYDRSLDALEQNGPAK